MRAENPVARQPRKFPKATKLSPAPSSPPSALNMLTLPVTVPVPPLVVLARGRVVRGPWGWRPLWQRPFSTYKSPKFYLSFTILVSFILVKYPDRIGLVNTLVTPERSAEFWRREMRAPVRFDGESQRGLKKEKDVRISNIMAAKGVADAIRTSLGPRGMDKMIQKSDGEVLITNDGATILTQMNVAHPTVRLVVINHGDWFTSGQNAR